METLFEILRNTVPIAYAFYVYLRFYNFEQKMKKKQELQDDINSALYKESKAVREVMENEERLRKGFL